MAESNTTLLNAFDYEAAGDEGGKLLHFTAEIEKQRRVGQQALVQIAITVYKAHAELAGVGRDGLFKPWTSSLGISRTQAYRLVSVGEWAEKCTNLGHLIGEDALCFANFDDSALYLLADKNTPQKAVDEAVKIAKRGDGMTRQEAKEIIAKHTEQPKTSGTSPHSSQPDEALVKPAVESQDGRSAATNHAAPDATQEAGHQETEEPDASEDGKDGSTEAAGDTGVALFNLATQVRFCSSLGIDARTIHDVVLKNVGKTGAKSIELKYADDLAPADDCVPLAKSVATPGKYEITPKAFFDKWNQLASDKPSLKAAAKLTDKRRDKLRLRLKDSEWWEAFQKASLMIPIRGEGWQPDFDWFITNADNVYKILEGKYDWRDKENGKPESRVGPPDTADPEEMRRATLIKRLKAKGKSHGEALEIADREFTK